MHIFIPEYTHKPNHCVFVQPGQDFPVTDWLGPDGKPIMFSVAFKFGKAEVADNLGQYMVDRRMAQRSPIIIQSGVDE